MRASSPLRVLLAPCVTGLLAGCGQPTMVANPDYEAWARFAPGSYVTFEGTQRTGDTQQALRVTEKLVWKDAGKVVLERTIRLLDETKEGQPRAVSRVEAARIDPHDDPRTHPGATVRVVGSESVEVCGRTYECEVRELEVHARFDGFVEAMEDIRARASVHPGIPGRFAKIHLQAKTADHEFELSGRAVGLKAVLAGED